MKIAAASRFRLSHAELALVWLGVTIAFAALRLTVFGVALSPTLAALFGAGDLDPLGPPTANVIALEDPLLILAAVAAAAIAAHHAFRHARDRL